MDHSLRQLERELIPIKKAEQASVEDIQKCSDASVAMYHAKFQEHPKFWNRRDAGYQEAFNARFEALGLPTL